ncbi:MAG: MarR family transcriptional regulator [Erythrobacter sp.]|uniref:MarR family winged helix-turn-helix transcriptional regulator n=1 Tax=Erythrobacter sp. TaxID=1042 RepID=UPI0032649C8C
MTDRPDLFGFFNEIGIINQLASAAFCAALPKGMTIAQFTILNHFARLEPGPTPPKDLAAAFQVTRATMTSTLTRMERAGFVAIKPNPEDGRGKLVSITKKGRAMREQCIGLLQNPIAEAGAVLASEDIEALLPQLASIRAKLDRARD